MKLDFVYWPRKSCKKAKNIIHHRRFSLRVKNFSQKLWSFFVIVDLLIKPIFAPQNNWDIPQMSKIVLL